MMNFLTVSCVNEKDFVQLKDELNGYGAESYEINGENIKDIKQFFKSIVNILPLDPPMSGNVNLDAFIDSLWGGLDNLGADRVAILWTHVNNMLEYGFSDLIKIIDCFESLAVQLATAKFGLSKPIALQIFLIGSGDNFPELRG